jgi:GTP-binding protein Era
VSAATGEGVDHLERAIIDQLQEGEPLYPADFLTDQPERFFAAELVREKLLQFTRAEIPFSSAVVVDRFEEADTSSAQDDRPSGATAAIGRAKPKDLLRVFCTIVVERESQKPIVVGKGGEMIKKIGSAAREELERFFRTRVFLDLHVRVKSEWRENDYLLDEIGLRTPE